MASPGELAESLLADGITGMKIWPFDAFATRTGGHHLALGDLRTGYRGYYRELVTELPRIEDGYLYPMQGAGLGSALLADRFARDEVKRVRSEAN